MRQVARGNVGRRSLGDGEAVLQPCQQRQRQQHRGQHQQHGGQREDPQCQLVALLCGLEGGVGMLHLVAAQGAHGLHHGLTLLAAGSQEGGHGLCRVVFLADGLHGLVQLRTPGLARFHGSVVQRTLAWVGDALAYLLVQRIGRALGGRDCIQVRRGRVVVDAGQAARRCVLEGQQHLHAVLQGAFDRLAGQQGARHRFVMQGL